MMLWYFLMAKHFLVLILISFLIFSCATDDASFSESTVTVIPEITGTESHEESEPVEETGVVAEEVISEEPEIITVPDPEPESEPEPVPAQNYSEEYLRSIGNLAQNDAVYISPEVFEEDKNEIFQVINALDQIMKKKDFNGWISYLTPESYEYWSNRHNLLELSRHLFSSDDFHINNIREYFEMFFIPARKGRLVDEIRYVTPTYVKVVQYKNKTDIIYYFFEKQNDTWLLKLDTL